MKQSKASSYAAALMCVISFATSTGWAKVEYDSNKLLMKNSEEVSELIQKRIQKAQQAQSQQEDSEDGAIHTEPEAVEYLKDAMRIALSRPDQDGSRAKTFSLVRRELSDISSLDVALVQLVKESIAGIKSGSTSDRHKETYITLLNNLLAELKPEVETNNSFKKVVEYIRDAKIEIPEKVQKKLKLRSSTELISPSDSAAKIVPKGKSKK